MESIKIAIVDDQKLFRIGLESVLKLDERIKVVASEKNGIDMLRKLNEGKTHPQVILLDIEIPELDGFETCRRITSYFPNILVLMLSMHSSDLHIKKAVSSGAHGYLVKDEEPEEIIKAIEEVIALGYYFNAQISMSTLQRFLSNDKNKVTFKDELLSPREIEIIQLICKELTDKEIALQMNISPRTVETYRKNIMKKIGAKKSVGIALYALKNHYIIP